MSSTSRRAPRCATRLRTSASGSRPSATCAARRTHFAPFSPFRFSREETTSSLSRLEVPSIRSSARKRSEEHTSELQSHSDLVCRLLLEKKKKNMIETNVMPLNFRHQRTERRGEDARAFALLLMQTYHSAGRRSTLAYCAVAVSSSVRHS